MADQVTISTFLELKDNLSPGLVKVEEALKRMTQQAALMNGALTKAAGALTPMSSGFKAVDKHLKDSLAHANALAAAVKNIKPPKLPPLPAGGRGAGGGGGGGGGAGGGAGGAGLFGGMIGANVLAYGIVRTLGVAKDAIFGYYDAVLEKNMEYEKSLAAISSAMYTMNVSPSMKVAESSAKGIISTLRDLAAKLPGETDEYVEVFQRTIPQALMSGARDTKAYAEFVSKYTAIAIQRGVGARIAASNLQLLLAGTARAGTKMAQVLSGYIGMTLGDLNKLSRPERFKIIQQGFEKAAGGLAATGDKADAIFGELKSKLDEIYRVGGAPLFEAAKSAAVELNSWLDKNKVQVYALATAVAETLGDALRGTVALAKVLGDSLLAVSNRIARVFESLGGAFGAGSTLFKMSAYAEKLGMAGPALGLKILGTGAMMRYAGEQRKAQAAAAERTAILTKYGYLEKTLPQAGVPGMASPMFRADMPQIMGNLEDRLRELAPGQLKKKSPFETKEDWAAFVEAKGFNAGELYADLIQSGKVKTNETPEARTSNYQDFRYSRFDINQAFAEGFDPDRIAVAFATDLAKLGEQKIESMNTPNFTPR